MKYLWLILCLMCFCCKSYAINITGLNSMPYETWAGAFWDNNLKLDVQSKKDFNGIEIYKNIFKFQKAYKSGRPYEYLIVNKTDKDIILNGVIQKDFVNRDYDNNSGWLRMRARYFRYWQSYIPFYDIIYSCKVNFERGMWVLDFPIDYTIKPNEELRIVAIGLKQKEIQNLKFLFDVNNKEIEIEY